jgi:UV DNA damage endonuclease
MIRLGLCCIFKKEPITFRRTTAAYVSRFSREEQLNYLSGICLHNAKSLLEALVYCEKNNILDFRINSQILPLKTHHDVGYDISELPGHKDIVQAFLSCGKFCRERNMRTTFHPDQFILLSSPTQPVVESSVRELEYHAEASEWVHADVINLHAGGAYGDKNKTLKRLSKQIDKLPDSIRSRLTIENDDRIFTPADLLPLCKDLRIPMVYDVHHHRCLPDGIGVEKTTQKAIETWNREPVFHLSSPREGWLSNDPRPHHDYIDPSDFPDCWRDLVATVEIEAKAKEAAVFKLKKALNL